MHERIVWWGPLGDRGGYGAVARNYVRGLVELGVQVTGAYSHGIHPELGERDRALLDSLPTEVSGDELLVAHGDPSWLAGALPKARELTTGPVAACTIAETDRMPAAWAQACNMADEVWVPSTFNMLTFARSGVDPERLRLVPYGIDVESWDPSGPVANVAPPDHFCFLYTFAFDWRKGFDLLLAAYLNEFTRDDPVTLVIKAYDPRLRADSIGSRLAASAAPFVDLFRQDLPHVVVLDQPMEREEIAALYRRADLYVSTDRANGWGMPCMEVMTLGGAAATVDWSGSTEFMHERNALLIPPGELVPVDARLTAERPDYAAQRWPAVSVDSIREVLRAAAGGQVDLAALGSRAREEILERWTARHAGRYVIERDSNPYRSRPGLAERLRPLVGLAAEPPLREARGAVFVAGYELGDLSWRDALDAYVEAFGRDDDVTLCVWGPEDFPEVEIGADVMAHCDAAGIDVSTAPDLIVSNAPADEALVEPGVRALIEPAAPWPVGGPRVPPLAAALRELVAAPAAA